jgi:hypothetical protein
MLADATVLCSMHAPRPIDIAAVPMAFTFPIFATCRFAVPYTGAGMNTARAFGPAAVTGFPDSSQWIVSSFIFSSDKCRFPRDHTSNFVSVRKRQKVGEVRTHMHIDVTPLTHTTPRCISIVMSMITS